MQRIPIYQPSLSDHVKQYVDECIDSTWISSKGKFISEFEQGFSEHFGYKHSIAVCNGTVALHLALLAVDIQPGDEVIVPTLTYIASANAINYCGATPIFVDSLADTWQLDPSEVEKKISARTRAILVVHLYGQPADMEAIMAIAKRHNLKVIEDCAEAIGTKYKDEYVGNFGHVASFSFFGNKTMTTGEGGMVCTDDPELAKKITKLKGQGLADGMEYWHDVIGYNYRITNVCAAIGVAQLEEVDGFIKRKAEIAKLYEKEFKTNQEVIFHKQDKDATHSYWMCSILVKNKEIRDSLRSHMSATGIETRPLFPPVHLMPMYRSSEKFPVAENLSERGMNLPSWPALTDEQVRYICDCINSFLGEK